MSTRVATDVGGTFTDLASFDAASNEFVISKSSTTVNITDGVTAVLSKAKLDIAAIDYFVHGSTIAANTVIERKGAVTGLMSTEGFRDTLEIGRANIPNSFDLLFTTPEPLVPRKRRLGVSERMLADGSILKHLDWDQAIETLRALEAAGVDAIAVCLLHSYANPEHERALKELISSNVSRPMFVSISSDIVRQYREFERTSTTVLNAYVGPRVGGYLDGLQVLLSKGNFRGNAMIMQSNGGTMPLDFARQQPVRMMESSPVGGTVAAGYIASQSGYPNVVAFDMGGTTAKVSLIFNGKIAISEGFWVEGEEHGYPLQLPVVDVAEIGAGGGSIAHIDELGALKIGPESAGAVPGPVAYGTGGVSPTVTDANLVLGRLNPAYFLAGEISLSTEKAKEAIQRDIAEPLGLEVSHAAFGIVKIADTSMALAVRQMTVQKGLDPRDFVLFAYGGGGPGHAVAIARELRMKTVLIPPYPGIFSAVGMLLSDAKESFVLSRVFKTTDAGKDYLDGLFGDMEREGTERMIEAGFELSDIEFSRAIDMRYVGQEYTLRVALPNDLSNIDVIRNLNEQFAQLHEVRYGHAFEHAETQVVALLLEVSGRLPKPVIRELPGGQEDDSETFRSVYFEGTGFVDCRVYRRNLLKPGDQVNGPAVIEEAASTTLVHPNDVFMVDKDANLVITLGA